MHILITGANGYIGSMLTRHLVRNHHNVRALVRPTSNLKLLFGTEVEIVYGDVTDPDSLTTAVKGIDLVVHSAGAVTDWGPMDYFKKVNVEGTQNTAMAAERAGVKRFVHISTVAIHGFDFQNATETQSTPETYMPYSKTKKMAEVWLNQFAQTAQMEIVMVRPGNVFGPYDEKFIQPYLDFIKKGGFMYINKGKALTCPTYIENLVQGIELACFHEQAKGESFIITDGLNIDWQHFTNAFVRRLNLPLPRRSLPFPLVYGVAYGIEMIYKLLNARTPPLLTRYRICNAGKDYHFSIEKAKNMLGYQPLVDFETSVDRTIAWYAQAQK